ncbi:sugar phosphate isomerase/epimerase family protein [Motilibacter deserti]|uniref:Sugar phosphate isomerase/epimerase n=1 Tax=Motilibacter deserti TaxID=2714956 RepID=A0ABX0H173_9ACTN|nr:sugar phosphate isomerase/epimerase [Motilibacter deserti]
MSLAFSNIAWPVEDDSAAFEVLVEAGYPGLEVAPTRIWDEPLEVPAAEVAAFRRTVERTGLRIVAMQSLLFRRPDLQVFGSAESRSALHDHLAGMARLAAGLGATRLVFGSPGNRKRGDIPMAEAMERAVEVFAPLAKEAEEVGVCFCIEANPTAYGCDFLVNAVESTAFVRAVGSPGVRLHLDSACMALGGDDAAERVRDGADVLAHVHASAPQLGEVGPDTGVDHERLATALREAGYAGSVSVEMRAQEDPVAAVRRSSSYVKDVYA